LFCFGLTELANNAKITIHTARPGIVIGKKGADIEALKSIVTKMMGMSAHINLQNHGCDLSSFF
jgi:small subunit ribosomal protein S3